MLDGLADVILDPELGAQDYEYERVTEADILHGRAVFQAERRSFRGNIQPASGRERQEMPEGDFEKETIVIFTTEPLTAGDAEARADRVFYHGSPYRVRLAEPWRFHAGFTRALAVLETRHAE